MRLCFVNKNTDMQCRPPRETNDSKLVLKCMRLIQLVSYIGRVGTHPLFGSPTLADQSTPASYRILWQLLKITSHSLHKNSTEW